MLKNIILLLYFTFSFSVSAQTYTFKPIDTADSAYRKNIKAIYTERSAKTAGSFNTFTDKNFRKVLSESYKEINQDFMDKVDAGYFVPAPYYEENINRLFRKITEANPEYTSLSSVKILISFSAEPNAYAMGDGFVVINVSLLANVESELELAYILSHELAHNLLNHPQRGLQDYAKLKTSPELKRQTREIEKQKYNKSEAASKVLKTTIYSKRKKSRGVEFQADSLGFVLYRNAFKEHEFGALNTFSTMDKMDKEKDSLQLSDYEKLFTSANQPFKKEWILNDEISIYRYDKSPKFWQIDSLKTHPACKDRAIKLKTLFNIKQGSTPVQNPDFNILKHNAEYNNLMGLYVLKLYGRSLYETLLLLKHKPEEAYLRHMVYANFIKIQEAQRTYAMNKYVDNVNPGYSTSYNTYLSFLRQLRKSELNEIINLYK